MGENKNIFVENFLFRLDSFGCDCVEDIIHTVPGEQPNIKLKLQALPEKKITFAFTAKKGLVKIAQNGSIEDDNIFGTLASLPYKSDKVFKQFVRANGFIFPVGTSYYEEFDKQEILSIIDRLRITVELMTAANEINKDYSKIFILMVQLFFAKDIHIKTEQISSDYNSCHNYFSDTIMNPAVTLSYKREQEKFNSDTYKIKDSICGSFDFKISDYDDIIGGYSQVPGYNEPLFKNIVALYVNYEGSELERSIIDVMFHFFYEVGIINTNQSLTYYAPPRINMLSQALKDGLIEVANYIVGEEINANLKGIHPIYDSKNMMPIWKVDSLLCAAYFSIFYLKPELELYRQCANPRCGRYFLVKTTSTRKKFCSVDCCNRVTQDRYRKNIRSKTE